MKETKKIALLIEDHPLMAEASTGLFQQLGLYVYCFLSPRDALDAVREGVLYDIAFVDSHFKGDDDMAGDHVIRALKSMHPKKPAGTLSSYDFPAVGADFHLQKGSREFREKLEIILRQFCENRDVLTV